MYSFSLVYWDSLFLLNRLHVERESVNECQSFNSISENVRLKLRVKHQFKLSKELEYHKYL